MHQQLLSVNIISNVKSIGLGLVKHRSHDCLGVVQMASFSSCQLAVLELVPGARPRPDGGEQEETER